MQIINENQKLDKIEFRKKLQEIADHYICDEQKQAIVELKKVYSYSIEVVREAIQGRPETFRYNCFMNTLNVNHEDPKNLIMLISEQELKNNYDTDIFVGVEFVNFCISNKYLMLNSTIEKSMKIVS